MQPFSRRCGSRPTRRSLSRRRPPGPSKPPTACGSPTAAGIGEVQGVVAEPLISAAPTSRIDADDFREDGLDAGRKAQAMPLLVGQVDERARVDQVSTSCISRATSPDWASSLLSRTASCAALPPYRQKSIRHVRVQQTLHFLVERLHRVTPYIQRMMRCNSASSTERLGRSTQRTAVRTRGSAAHRPGGSAGAAQQGVH